MKESDIQKKKLLTMLTELHDQLGELETVLQSSLSELRNELLEEQAGVISACGDKLAVLEENLDQLNFDRGSVSLQRDMKLELGF